MSETDDPPERSFRPAVAALDERQGELVDQLEDRDGEGFAHFLDRSAILLWCQQVSMRSLGRIPDGFAAGLLGDTVTVAALLTDEARRERLLNVDDVPAPGTEDSRFRRENVADTVDEAFRDAIRDMAQQAGEYGGDSSKPQNPATQRYLAMRPVLDELDELHQAVLEDGLEGFGNVRELRTWLRRVTRVTDGLIDDEFALACRFVPLWKQALLGGEGHLETRVQLLAYRLYPYLNATVRTVVAGTGEVAETVTEDHTPPMG